MKKIITSLFAVFLALGMSAQNFGVGLDYMMLQGTMVEGKYLLDGETDSTEISGNSAVLNVSYTYSLSEKLDMAGSIGLGMGFGLVPMKLGMSYAMWAIDVNVGMGLYRITDASYISYRDGLLGTEEAHDHDGEDHDDEDGKSAYNEFGMNFGIVYNMNDVGIGVGYDMIKGDGNKTLNAVTINLSYAFGGNSADEGE